MIDSGAKSYTNTVQAALVQYIRFVHINKKKMKIHNYLIQSVIGLGCVDYGTKIS